MSSAVSAILPALTAMPGVTSFNITVLPFLLPLRDNVLALANGTLSPWDFYHSTNPFATALLFSQLTTVFTFLLSEITGNPSQVDRLWSILPALYVGHFTYFAHHLGLPTSRLDTLAVLVTIWAVRLSFNYWRKGGYGWGHQDYRWAIVKKDFPRGTWWIFDLTFIAWFQNTLLLAVSAIPAYFFLLTATLPANALVAEGVENVHADSTVDLVFSRGIMLALLAELFADQQQWAFHQAKKRHAAGEEVEGWDKADLERGFNVTGLFSFSRHPAFLAEMSVWVLIYQWTCFVTNTVYNYAGIGVFFYCMIFQGSTKLTESISASKYPEYAEYQKLVGKFMPKLSAFWEKNPDRPAPAAAAVVEENEEAKKEK
ncbi:DUF1295 domain protein [Peziza echinospora]|nr:DUF1295 domain protein [Peziza echinospora]